jgi:hypothetical protein
MFLFHHAHLQWHCQHVLYPFRASSLLMQHWLKAWLSTF